MNDHSVPQGPRTESRLLLDFSLVEALARWRPFVAPCQDVLIDAAEILEVLRFIAQRMVCDNQRRHCVNDRNGARKNAWIVST